MALVVSFVPSSLCCETACNLCSMRAAISGSQSCLFLLLCLMLSVSIAAFLIASVKFPTYLEVSLFANISWTFSLNLTIIVLGFPFSSVSGPMSMFLKLISGSAWSFALSLPYCGCHGVVICMYVGIGPNLNISNKIVPGVSRNTMLYLLLPIWSPGWTYVHADSSVSCFIFCKRIEERILDNKVMCSDKVGKHLSVINFPGWDICFLQCEKWGSFPKDMFPDVIFFAFFSGM